MMLLNMNYRILGLVLIGTILISGCVSQGGNKIGETTFENNGIEIIPNAQRLDNLCSGEAECNTFCHDNKGRCKNYCDNNLENEICQRLGFAKSSCETGEIKFDYAPVDLDKTTLLLPLGLMAGGHVTPVDHHYFQNFNNEKFDIKIYSPGKGHITSIQHMPGAKEGEDYRIIIDHTCTISSIYIHVGLLTERLQKYAPEGMNTNSGNIPVEAGELLGYYKTNVDYNLVDTEIVLPGFIVPEHYKAESWKIHIPNTYDYFNEPVRSKIIEKSLRTVEPLSGKIDYDIDGKLVGNWFLEGSDGYSGDSTHLGRYWLGHLSIVYDAYDTDTIILSIANYEGEDSRQYAVKGNSPDPASIGVDNGLI